MTRTLAVDPTYRGLAFVVLDDARHELLDWGIKLGAGSVEHSMSNLITYFEPSLVVSEKPVCSRLGRRGLGELTTVARITEEKGIPRATVCRNQIRQHFHSTGESKYAIACAIADQFPVLSSRLPKQRKIWESEDIRMNIFDALSFALTALSIHRGKG